MPLAVFLHERAANQTDTKAVSRFFPHCLRLRFRILIVLSGLA